MMSPALDPKRICVLACGASWILPQRREEAGNVRKEAARYSGLSPQQDGSGFVAPLPEPLNDYTVLDSLRRWSIL